MTYAAFHEPAAPHGVAQVFDLFQGVLPRPWAEAAATKVLLVGDQDLAMLGISLLILREPGMQSVGPAHDVAEAQRLASDVHPGMIIVELSMTSDLGFDVAYAMRQAYPHTPLVLLAEAARGSIVQEALRLHAVGLLLKNQSASELRRALRGVIAGESIFPEDIASKVISDGNEIRPADIRPLANVKSLTQREFEVLKYLAQGVTIKDCAKLLGRSRNTIDNHKAHIMKKLGLHRTVDLVLFAVRAGLVRPDRASAPREESL